MPLQHVFIGILKSNHFWTGRFHSGPVCTVHWLIPTKILKKRIIVIFYITISFIYLTRICTCIHSHFYYQQVWFLHWMSFHFRMSGSNSKLALVPMHRKIMSFVGIFNQSWHWNIWRTKSASSEAIIDHWALMKSLSLSPMDWGVSLGPNCFPLYWKTRWFDGISNTLA